MPPPDHCRQPKDRAQKEQQEDEGDHTYSRSKYITSPAPVFLPAIAAIVRLVRLCIHILFNFLRTSNLYSVVWKEELGQCARETLANFQFVFCDQRDHYYGGTT